LVKLRSGAGSQRYCTIHGRTSKHEITVYAGVGLAFQDTIAAWQIYRAAIDWGMARAIEFSRPWNLLLPRIREWMTAPGFQ
jgi:hypothetical protein